VSNASAVEVSPCPRPRRRCRGGGAVAGRGALRRQRPVAGDGEPQLAAAARRWASAGPPRLCREVSREERFDGDAPAARDGGSRSRLSAYASPPAAQAARRLVFIATSSADGVLMVDVVCRDYKAGRNGTPSPHRAPPLHTSGAKHKGRAARSRTRPASFFKWSG